MTHKPEEINGDIEIKLDILLKRFCYRNGRHGETYLLEKGLREGLTTELIKLIKDKFVEGISAGRAMEKVENPNQGTA